MNIQVHLNDNSLIHGQTYEELAQQLKTGFLLIAYLKAELSLGEFAELMNMEYLEAREWLLRLGIPMMREKAPELEQLMRENLQKFMQQRGLNMSG
jgi:predicted HTH domain antitoxin